MDLVADPRLTIYRIKGVLNICKSDKVYVFQGVSSCPSLVLYAGYFHQLWEQQGVRIIRGELTPLGCTGTRVCWTFVTVGVEHKCMCRLGQNLHESAWGAECTQCIHYCHDVFSYCHLWGDAIGLWGSVHPWINIEVPTSSLRYGESSHSTVKGSWLKRKGKGAKLWVADHFCVGVWTPEGAQ